MEIKKKALSIERAAASILVEKEISKSLPEQTKVRINKTTVLVDPDIAPIFGDSKALKAIRALDDDRLELAIALLKQHEGSQAKINLIKEVMDNRHRWEAYQSHALKFPVGSEIRIVRSKTGVWDGHTGFVLPYKKDPTSARLVDHYIHIEVCSATNKCVVKPLIEADALELINQKFVNPPYSQGLIGKCIQFAIGQFVDTNHCGTNLEVIEINGDWLRCKNKQDQKFFINRKDCLPISTGLEALEPSVIQPELPAKFKQSDTLTSAKMLKPSTIQTSLKSQSLETLERSLHQQESTSLLVDSPVQEPQTQELKQDSYIQSLLSGLNISELSTKGDPDLSSSKTQLQLLVTHCEQYLEDSEWSDIVGTIHKSYRQLSLEVPKNGSDCLSLPTLTTNKGVKSRSSGQSKCEKWFRDKGLLLDTQCLSPQMMAVLFGFPSQWTKCLWDVQGVQTGELDLDKLIGIYLSSYIP